MNEEAEEKINDLEFELEDIKCENEEIQIDLNILIKEMKEENDRASKHDDNPYDIGQWNIYKLEQIEKLVKNIRI